MIPRFRKAYKVHVYETAPNGKLSLYSMFNYLQDIASDHAEELGYGRYDLLKHSSIWVLSRIYAEIHCLPAWGEDIYLETWPNGTDKLFALRNYEVTRKNGEMIARAVSSWLILDMKTRRIQRPDLFFGGREFPFEPFPVRNAGKLETNVEQEPVNHCLRIKTSDLDINLHTNNAVYLKWITDHYDPQYIMNHDPQSVEINYLAESRHDEEIEIRSASGGEESFNHSIIRTNDKKELCRMRMVWKPVTN